MLTQTILFLFFTGIFLFVVSLLLRGKRNSDDIDVSSIKRNKNIRFINTNLR